MKCIITLVFALSLSTISLAQDLTMNLSDFSELDISGNFDVIIKEGNPKLEITVNKGEIDKVMIGEDNNALSIQYKKKKTFGWSTSKHDIDVILYTDQSINEFDISASAYVESDIKFKGEKIKVEASSGSKANLILVASHIGVDVSSSASTDLSVQSDKLNTSVSSGSSATFEGDTGMINVSASSGASCNAKMLQAKNAKTKASSGASIKVWVNEDLKGSVSSGGSVRYKGTPSNVDVSKSSGGSVKEM